MGKPALSKSARSKYSKLYGIAGAHSGVQICSWSFKSLRGKGVCYKQKFYGIDCHRCCQMSPSLAWCNQSCIFCWRPMEWMSREGPGGEKGWEEPGVIISACVKERKRLLGGVGGAKDSDRDKFNEAFRKFPSHWAISLSGEPTIYPKICGLVKELKKSPEVRSIFVVSNGQEPKRIAEMQRKKCLPTQLYISVDAPNENLFKKINRPSNKAGWKRLNRTLALLPKLKCRRVIRFTLIKGLNDDGKFFPEYAELFSKSGADFIEVKGYMFLGQSRKRLKFENMPTHEYVSGWCRKLASHLRGMKGNDYGIIDEDYLSRIVLFRNRKSKYKAKIGAKL